MKATFLVWQLKTGVIIIIQVEGKKTYVSCTIIRTSIKVGDGGQNSNLVRIHSRTPSIIHPFNFHAN